ncbi:MAG: hypothetical protein ACOC53_06495 [Candidatus Saliniplasma sp.]
MLSKRDEGIVNNFRNLENIHLFTGSDNKIVIQYWFFYLNNPGVEYLTAHEGDWEMIQIICDENGNPQKAGYSWHYGGDKSGWNSDAVNKVDGRNAV